MSKLEDMGNTFRPEQLVKSIYNSNNEYNAGNKNALSDGDEKGKNDNGSGEAGSATDIKTRETLLVKNKFNKNREYNSHTA